MHIYYELLVCTYLPYFYALLLSVYLCRYPSEHCGCSWSSHCFLNAYSCHFHCHPYHLPDEMQVRAVCTHSPCCPHLSYIIHHVSVLIHAALATECPSVFLQYLYISVHQVMHATCILDIHTQHAYSTCILYMHTLHAYSTCILDMHTRHAYSTCILYMHTLPDTSGVCVNTVDEAQFMCPLNFISVL